MVSKSAIYIKWHMDMQFKLQGTAIIQAAPRPVWDNLASSSCLVGGESCYCGSEAQALLVSAIRGAFWVQNCCSATI